MAKAKKATTAVKSAKKARTGSKKGAKKAILRPPVAAAQPPWLLNGDAYMVLLSLPQEFKNNNSFTPPTIKQSPQGALSLLMFVDYKSSDVGPYHEILYIPGKFDFDGKLRWSITRIFVSSWDSVVNGEDNWGIPKDRADFDVRYDENGFDHIQVAYQGRQFADLKFKSYGPGIPVWGGLVPASMRTLAQIHKNQIYTYTPSTNGSAKFARLIECSFDQTIFPDVSVGTVLAATKLCNFRMTFPESRIKPL